MKTQLKTKNIILQCVKSNSFKDKILNTKYVLLYIKSIYGD